MINIFDTSYWEQYNIKDYSKLVEYLEFIKNIKLLGNRDLNYCEHHHIVPKSFDSSLSSISKNIIKLSSKEHFIAHEMLADCFTGIYNQKMVYAIKRLIDNPRFDYNITPDEYEEIKTKFSSMLSDKYKINSPFLGKHHTDESKKKISNSRKLYFKNMTKEEYEQYCSVRKRENLSPQARQNMSLGQMGNKNRLGKKFSEESKRKISESLKGKMSGNNNPNFGNKIVNKFWMTNGVDNIRVGYSDIEKYISRGYKRGRISRKREDIIERKL